MIFFFHGPNTFAQRRQVEEMAAAYTKKTGSELGIERVDGAETDRNRLLSALEAVPFLATSRLVIITKLSQNSAMSGQIEAITQHIPSSTVVVFAEGVVDKRTVYYKTLIDVAKSVVFEHLKGAAARAWVPAEAKRLGGSITAPAVQALLERAGGEAWRMRQEIDQWRLHHELAKLVSYQPEITPTEIEQLVEPSPSQSIFDLVEAITSGRTNLAVQIYHGLVESQVNELYILTMLIWQLRNLLLAKTAGPRGPGELASAAGMSPYVARRVLAQQRQFTEERLVAAFQRAVATEYDIKTGEAPAELLVERLIYDLAGQ